MSQGKRKSKPSRAQLRGAEPLDTRQRRSARHRRRLLSLLPVAAAILASTAIILANGPRFPYRLGQRADRDLRVNVENLSRPDPVRTTILREQAARRVPPIFENNPEPIRELQKQLIDLINAIADAEKPTLQTLPERIVDAWGLDQSTIEILRAASDTPERRDDLRRQIAAAFEPIIRDGVLPRDLLPLDEESGSHIQIERERGLELVSRDHVVPDRLALPDGEVAERFIGEFRSPDLGRSLFRLIAERLVNTPTLRLDLEETNRARQEARNLVEDQSIRYSRGQLIVERGQPITEEQLEILRDEYERLKATRRPVDRFRRASTVLVFVASLFALMSIYVDRHRPEIASNPARIAVLCASAVAALGLARLLAIPHLGAELIPIALVAMTFAVAFDTMFALVVTFGLALLTSLALASDLIDFMVLMGGTAAGVLALREVRTRTKPIVVGAISALAYALLTAAAGLWRDQPGVVIAVDGGLRAGWGLLSGFLLGGTLPFVESAFGLITGISLLELGDVNHPLLQELVRRAPGTHNHSITVGTIAEAAAEKVGADALLVRVGAYFHDIGKMLKPHYFAENQTAGVNRHANLAPAMSTLIIIGHVKDGADLARQHNLPRQIIDLIEQHHGTTLVEYFYHEASKRHEQNAESTKPQESAFRYPGPKPQSKEAAILMMSDAVESASRALSDPTPSRLEGLVSDLIDKRLRDGQFDECDLTLREIAVVRESLIKSMTGIYHGRVKYPEPKSA